MTRRPPPVWPVAFCLLLPLPACADAPPTLAQALALAAAPKTGLALSVGAAFVPLPEGATLPGVVLSVSETAALYEKQAPTFGDMFAVASRSHTVVYAPPETPTPTTAWPPSRSSRCWRRPSRRPSGKPSSARPASATRTWPAKYSPRCSKRCSPAATSSASRTARAARTTRMPSATSAATL